MFKTFQYLIIKIVLVVALLFLGYGNHSLFSQQTGFTETYFVEGRSTFFHAVRQFEDDLIILGQLGTDEFGNNGVFILRIDTLGEIKNLKIFQHPLNKYNLDLGTPGVSSTEALDIYDNKIYFAGQTQFGVNLFIICLNEDLSLHFYKEYPSIIPYARKTPMIKVFNDEIYTLGYGKNSDLDTEILIHKTDIEGNQIWYKSYNNINYHDFANSFCIEDEGLTVMVNSLDDPNDLEPNNDIWYNSFFHIDSSGMVLWSWNGEQNEEGQALFSVIKSGSDYYYITIPVLEEGNGSIESIHYRPQLVKRDQNFNLVWRKNYGEFYYRNVFTSLSFGPDGALCAAGYIPEDVTWGRVVKIDTSEGSIIWDTRDTAFVIPGWGSRNRMEGITVLLGGSVISVGYTMDHTFHENGLVYKITKDGCIDTLCSTVAISELSYITDDHVNVFPNPACQFITFELSDEQTKYYLKIYSIDGILIHSEVLSSGSAIIKIDKSKFQSGIYGWKIHSDSGVFINAGQILILPD